MGPVWHDAPDVKVALQAFDARGNTAISTTKLNVVAERNLEGSAERVVASCNAAAPSGICVATVTIPQTWFAGRSSTVTLSYGVALAGAAVSVLEPVVTLMAAPASLAGQNVFIHMPLRPLLPGDVARIPIGMLSEFPVTAYTLTFAADAAISILGAEAASDRWSVVTARGDQANRGEFAVNAQVSALNIGAGSAGEEDIVLYLVVEVQPVDPAATASASLACTVGFVLNSKNEKIRLDDRSTPTSAAFVDRRGVGVADEGRVYIVPAAVAHLLAYVGQAELVNIAVVSGARVETTLSAVTVSSRGELVPATDVQCFSLDTSVVKVTGTCSSIYLDGSESRGHHAAQVKVSSPLAGSSGVVTVTLRVWFPRLPVEVSLPFAELRPVHDWLDAANDCQQVYQALPLSVFATYELFGQAPFTVTATHSIIPHVISSAEQVVAVERTATGVWVRGLAPGWSLIRIRTPLGRTVGTTVVFVVADRPVMVTGLEVTVIKALHLSLPAPALYPVTSAQVAAVAIDQTLTQEQQRAAVVVTAILDDDTRQVVTAAAGLTMLSTQPERVAIAEDYASVTALASGEGPYLAAAWSLPGCHPRVLATGEGHTVVQIPAPDEVVVTLTARLARAGDAAALPGVAVPTTTGVKVQLRFGAILQDMTHDPRTVFDLAFAEGVFTLARDGDTAEAVVTAAAVGVGSLLVQFRHVNIVRRVEITVVTVSRLELVSRPFPPYAGSEMVEVQRVMRLGASGVPQELSLELRLVLSDGTAHDVSTAGPVFQTFIS